MRATLMGIAVVGWIGLGWAGCGGCGGCGDKAPPDKPVAKPQAKAPAKPAEVAKRDLVTPSRVHKPKGQKAPQNYREGRQSAGQDKPMSIHKVPQVTRQEIDADPRLANPKLPIASKRTLKVLEKMQKQNPHLTKPDSYYKAEKNADAN